MTIISSTVLSVANLIKRHHGVLAASAIVPFFYDSEDRGYFRTAMITTPILFAGAEMLPKLFSTAKTEAESVFHATMSTAKNPIFNTAHNIVGSDLSKLAEDGTVGIRTVEEAQARYSMGLAKARPIEDINNLYSRATGLLKATDQNRRMMSQAVVSSAQDAMTPYDWISTPKVLEGLLDKDNRTNVSMSDDKMLEIAEFFKGRGDTRFPRRLQSNMDRIEGLVDQGAFVPAGATFFPPDVVTNLQVGSWSEAIEEKLSNAGAGGVSNILKNRSNLDKLNLQVKLVSQGVIDGSTADASYIDFVRTMKDVEQSIRIPIPDANGAVRIGPYIGTARSVMDYDGKIYRIDEWVAKMVTEGNDYTEKQLMGDINRAVFFTAHDPADTEAIYSQAGSRFGKNFAGENQVRLKSQAAVLTSLPRFKMGDEAVSFEKLDPLFQSDFERKLINSGTVSMMGPESAWGNRVYQLRKMEDFAMGGVADVTKQDWNYRSLSKGVSYEFVQNKNGLDLKPKVSTTAYEEFLGTKEVPEFNMRLAGISPQEKTLLGDFGMYKTWEEAQAYKPLFIERAMEMNISPAKAEKAFNDIEHFYRSKTKLDKFGKPKLGYGATIFEQIGSLGETDIIISDALAKTGRLKYTTTYEVDQMHFNPEDWVGKDVEDDFKFGTRQNKVVSPDSGGKILSTKAADESTYHIIMEHYQGMDAAKHDTFGVKGEFHTGTYQGNFQTMLSAINDFRKTTRTGDVIDKYTVNGIADWTYAQNKMDPMLLRMSIAEDTLHNISSRNKAVGEELISSATEQLAKVGVDYTDGQMIFQHEFIRKQFASREAKIANMEELNSVIDKIMADATASIRSKKGLGYKVYQGWYNKTGSGITDDVQAGKSLEAYMLRNGVNVNVRTWAHANINLPEHATVTHDYDTFSNLGDKRVMAAELRNRLQTVGEGDPEMSMLYGQYLQDNDYTKPMRESEDVVVDLDKAFLGSAKLSRPEGRHGTIFDPSDSRYKENFRVKYLDKEGKPQFIPVPGTDAYMSISPEYNKEKGVGYQTHDWQNQLHNIYNEEKAGNIEARDALIEGIKRKGGSTQGIIDAIHDDLLTGKNSAWRPRSYDPLGRSGYITTRGGTAEPFIVGISSEELKALPASIQQGIEKQGFGTALLGRQPYGDAVAVKVIEDKHLKGTKFFSINEIVRMLIGADDDLDPANLHYYAAGSTGEAEALRVMAPGGRQARRVENFRALMGSADESASVRNPVQKDLAERLAKKLALMSNLEAAVANRSAAEATGTLSLASGRMLAHIERSPAFKNNEVVRDYLTDIAKRLRQAPIDARKTQTLFNKQMAMNIANEVKESFKLGTSGAEGSIKQGAEMLRRAVLKEGILVPVDWNPVMGKRFNIPQPLPEEIAKGGGKVNAAARWLETPEGITASEDLMKGATRETENWVDITSGVLTGGKKVTREIYNKLEASVPPTFRKAFMAMSSAADLGTINTKAAAGASMRSIASTVTELFRGDSGKVLGVGLAIAAGAGLLFNRPRNPKQLATAKMSRPSGHRPEERIGTDGAIPGEPITGSMAPTNPPKSVRYVEKGVRTTMVAPMNRTSNVEATIVTDSARQGADYSRAAAMMSSNGDVNATINYKVNNKLGSLRNRERIREIRDEQ